MSNEKIFDNLVLVAKVGETEFKCHPDFVDIIKNDPKLMEQLYKQLQETEDMRKKMKS